MTTNKKMKLTKTTRKNYVELNLIVSEPKLTIVFDAEDLAKLLIEHKPVPCYILEQKPDIEQESKLDTNLSQKEYIEAHNEYEEKRNV